MSRKGGHRAAGSDVHRLWDLPPTEVSSPALSLAQGTTGRTEVDMTELRDLARRIEAAVEDGRKTLRELRIETRQARRVLANRPQGTVEVTYSE